MSKIIAKVDVFGSRLGMEVPIVLAPMAGVPAPGLSVAGANAGGFGACGVLFIRPDEIAAWVDTVRAGSNGLFQLNTWIPGPAPERDRDHEARIGISREVGNGSSADAGDATRPSFEQQCQAMLERVRQLLVHIWLVLSSFDRQLKQQNILWLATISTVAEAGRPRLLARISSSCRAEAGGHRGSFVADNAERSRSASSRSCLPSWTPSAFPPLPQEASPMDGYCGALMLGASAVEIGTGFLRCPEVDIIPPGRRLWLRPCRRIPASPALSADRPQKSPHRLRACAMALDAPRPSPNPVQRGFTAAMRRQAQEEGDVQRMQAWAGQSARVARADLARDVVQSLWQEAHPLLRGV